MDWYYPILGGALRGDVALARIDAGWSRFVVPQLGVRCVSDQPVGDRRRDVLSWYLPCARSSSTTGRPSCSAGSSTCATRDGSYWTGYVYPDEARWPEERTTWTAGAALLASAMLARDPATTTIFGGAELPMGPADILDACDLDVAA